MTCTPAEEETFMQFQRGRDSKMLIKKVPIEEKEEMTKDSKKKAHQRSEGKSLKRNRKVLENLYPPNTITYGDKNETKKKKIRKENEKRLENKENRETSRKTVGQTEKREEKNRGENGTQKDDRKEKQQDEGERLIMLKSLMVDLEVSSVGTVEPAFSICADEEGFSDEEVVLKTFVEPVSPIVSPTKTPEIPEVPTVPAVPETSAVQAITTIPPSKPTQTTEIYTPTPTKLLKLQQLKKSQQTRFILNVGGTKFETSAEVINYYPDSVLAAMIAEDSPMKPYLIDGRSSYFID